LPRGWRIRVESSGTLARSACVVGVLCLIAGTAAGVVAARPQVAGLQVALRSHGLYAGPIDGLYGPATARGLRQFQRRAGLDVDGQVGPLTRHALGRLGRPSFGRRTLRRGAVGWDVSVAQFLLTPTDRGLTVDGSFGPGTERALRQFQRNHALAVDGIAGPRTLTALLSSRSKRVAAGVSRAGVGLVRGLIDYWAAHYGVDRTLVHALAWMESGYQSNLRSPSGAWGVMQILPTTWSYAEDILIGESVRRTVSGNIRVGVAFLRQLLREFGGDERAALGAWYQGPASLRKHGPFRVTRAFVEDVVALRRRFD
jgi:peptidoglycan hydrolase-like protein with peptidoglycan-binding domain